MSNPPPRDWDKELAEIDRAIAKSPAGPPAGGAPAPAGPAGAPSAPTHAGPTRPGMILPRGGASVTRGALAGTWVKVLLAAALTVALVIFPYPKVCGLQLVGYFAVAGVAFLASLWALAATWRHHRGLGHVVALLALLGTLALSAAEILPRVGYARESRAWTCAAAPAPAPTTQPPASRQPAPQPAAPTP
jgi:hypothetical protein